MAERTDFLGWLYGRSPLDRRGPDFGIPPAAFEMAKTTRDNVAAGAKPAAPAQVPTTGGAKQPVETDEQRLMRILRQQQKFHGTLPVNPGTVRR